MTQPLSEPPAEAKSRPAFSWLPYVLVMIPIAIGMGTSAWRRSSVEWTTVLVEAARRLLKAGSVFGATTNAQINGYVYPPFSALAVVPFTWLSDKASQLVFYLMSLTCLCLMTRLAWDLSGGRTDRSSSKSAKAEHATFLLACAIAIKFAFNALSHLQTDLVVDALLMLGTFGPDASAIHRRWPLLGPERGVQGAAAVDGRLSPVAKKVRGCHRDAHGGDRRQSAAESGQYSARRWPVADTMDQICTRSRLERMTYPAHGTTGLKTISPSPGRSIDGLRRHRRRARRASTRCRANRRLLR